MIYQADHLTVTTSRNRYQQVKAQVYNDLTHFDNYCLLWCLISLVGLAVALYNLLGDADPFLVMIALEITLGKSKRTRDGILVTPII